MSSSLRGVLRRVDRSARGARLHATARQLRSAGLVQPDWYFGQGVTRSGDAATDWLLRGRREDRSPNPLFESQWVDPDGWGGPTDPLVHHLRHPDLRRGAHPLHDPRRPLGPLLAELQDDDLLQAAPGSSTSPLTWKQWRKLLEGAQEVLDGEVRRARPRATTGWDEREDAAYVRRWTQVSVPPGADPVVSVVMPVRDRPELVARAIESVQAQTFSHWELLVVDDGSTDSTPDVVAAIAAEDSRVRLLRRPASGVCRTRNAGIDAACGRYVAFLDSDNQWTPHFLSVMSAVMTTDRLRSAFAVTEERGDTGTRYRTFAGNVADLRTGNFVDLNVLVVERSLLAEVGGFDPSLRRMVDYDLAWRLAEHGPMTLLPFVGVRYRASASAADRISVRESLAWDDVVKARRLVDWPALAEAMPHRRADLLSVIVPVRQDWRAAQHTVRAALDLPVRDGLEVEVVVVDNASRPGAWRLLWALFGAEPAVRILRSPVNLHRAAATSVGVADSHGRLVVVLPAGLAPGTGWARLLEPLTDGAAAVVRPGGSGPDDPAAVLATTADCFVRLGGLDPLFVNEFEVADYCRRVSVAALGPVRVLADEPSTPLRPYEPATDPQHADNLREWARRWPDAPPPTGSGPA